MNGQWWPLQMCAEREDELLGGGETAERIRH